MSHDFDKTYWEEHWQALPGRAVAPNPYLADETGGLLPGRALDAGCGEGAEALWLAARGWQVTAADISGAALARAAERATAAGLGGQVTWVEADLSTWAPEASFDLVTTHYAHPAIAQLAFYERVAGWVIPGGTLLVVGHLHTAGTGHTHDHAHGHPPAEASVTAASVSAILDPERWDVVTATEQTRTVGGHAGELHDVVVRATRLP